MKDSKKMTIIILIMVLGVFLVLGGTFAYWQWITSEDQQTLVNVSLTDDAKMYIDFPAETLTNLYPTSDCDPRGTSSWVTTITVDNSTGVMLSPQFRLKLKIEDKNNNIITNAVSEIEGLYKNNHPNRYYIKYAVTSENGSCDKPLFAGRFDRDPEDVIQNESSDWYDSELITRLDDTTHFPIVSGRPESGVSFYAQPNTHTTQKFKVWVWLSNEYTSVTQGTESTDIMQDAKVTVSWSENSELLQVKLNDSYAVYSETDNSLRFYRSNTPIQKDKEYNGLMATEVYTGFETTKYESESEIPWYSKRESISSMIFEDTIYPTDDSNIRLWFSSATPTNHIDGGTHVLDVSKLDVSNLTDMSNMFPSYLNIIGLENWDVSNVTNMSNMFSHSNNEIKGIENWDVSNVTNMSNMFYSIFSNIENLDLSGWDTSNVTNMSYMFADSTPNKSIETWDTSNVTDMYGMFSGFSWSDDTLELDLRGWNVCNVTEIGSEIDSTSDHNIIWPYFNDPTKCNGGNPA